MSKSLVERVTALEVDMTNMEKQIDRLTEINDQQLAKLDRLSRLVWMGVGGIMVLQCILYIISPIK